MGFLDRLAGDLIADSIGLPPGLTRGLVRRALGNEVVLMGGAALAGALVSEMVRGQQGQQPGQPAAWGTPPPPPGFAPPAPPPPPPGFVPPPPPPPGFVPPPPPGAPAVAATPAPPATPAAVPPIDEHPPLPPQILYAVVRTMVAAALADGVLAPSERARIQDQLGSGELAPEHADQVRKDLLLPAAPEELAAMVSSEGERALLYRFAALVTRVDAGVSPAEQAWLDRLAAALGLAPARARALEAELLAAGG